MLRDGDDCRCPCWMCAIFFTIILFASDVNKPEQQTITLSSTMFPIDSHFTEISTEDLFNKTLHGPCFVPMMVTTSEYGEFDIINFTIRRNLRGGHSGGHSGHSAGHSDSHTQSHSESSQTHGNPTYHRSTSVQKVTTAILVLRTLTPPRIYLSIPDKKYVLYKNEVCIESATFTLRADPALWGNSWFGSAK